jgi:transcriptional regulator with XRE-family HTH domain
MPKKSRPRSKLSLAVVRASGQASNAASKLKPSSKPRQKKTDGVLSKKPNLVDQHVGRRMRLRRVLLGLSQEDLAQRLGGSSQLMQKYEAGETRVSASRLYEIGQQLGVPITWFFADLDSDAGALGGIETGQVPVPLDKRQRHIADLMASREARDLVSTYFAILDPRLRKKVLEMAGLLTNREEDEQADLA